MYTRDIIINIRSIFLFIKGLRAFIYIDVFIYNINYNIMNIQIHLGYNMLVITILFFLLVIFKPSTNML